MSSAVVDAALKTLARFAVDDAPAASPEERIAWAEALIDSGDPVPGADQLIAVLRAGPAPATLPEVARHLPDEQARSVLAAAIDNARLTTAIYDKSQLLGGYARLAAGSDEAEEALLRAVLVVEQYEDELLTRVHRERRHRVAAVVAALAEAHPGEPERLDLWASILGEADRPRLAAAAGLLAPLGLAEIDRRCSKLYAGTDSVEAPPLARALAEAGRTKEALELATRLQPFDRQQALFAVAEVVTDEREASTVVAAFRAAPKVSRERQQQLAHQHRLALILLGFGRADDALTELSKMSGRRSTSSAPIDLARAIVEGLGRRPDLLTDERLRAVVDAVKTAGLHPYWLSNHIAALLHDVFMLAGPALRAEVLGTRAATFRAALPAHDPGQVDFGLAAALIETGRADEGAALLRAVAAATPDRRHGFAAELLITAAGKAGLPEHDPDLFAEIFGLIAALAAYPPPLSSAPAVLLGPTGRATAARVIDRFLPNRHPGRLTNWLAEAAARSSDFDTLGILLEKVTVAPEASLITCHLAAALARHGDRAAADTLADACGLL
ncbi:hypothetical protein [Actinoplanes friuliensis]|uniref:Uncharacterized protein n=1 Tax=Actinoplanes friuliensis DSM 7358 TaxID=1246995 RepID=U5VZ47_9ACTN|nr:hypothetical protein [Actinoplanes friuliensis]AGZ40956.1 hypothetical protein AFR_13350 [Actinoplanes friuliensis DSM 7358]